MTLKNKENIRKLNKGFETVDTENILSCLADDVRWDVADVLETELNKNK